MAIDQYTNQMMGNRVGNKRTPPPREPSIHTGSIEEFNPLPEINFRTGPYRNNGAITHKAISPMATALRITPELEAGSGSANRSRCNKGAGMVSSCMVSVSVKHEAGQHNTCHPLLKIEKSLQIKRLR